MRTEPLEDGYSYLPDHDLVVHASELLAMQADPRWKRMDQTKAPHQEEPAVKPTPGMPASHVRQPETTCAKPTT